MRPALLIIDDEESICISLSLALEDSYNVTWETDADRGLKLFRENRFDAILLDLVIGARDGVEVLREIKALNANTPVIMMTAYGNVRSSVAAMKAGAFTYLTKPLDMEELRLFISQAVEFLELTDKVSYLTDELEGRYKFGGMIGESRPMQQVCAMIEKLKDLNSTVIISGESGTGKEMAAKAIHFSGRRKNGRFVTVNCAAIPEGLIEDEFFGHKRGAFTGAIGDKKGYFEAADKGTLFLDEIGDMPLGMQGKLLRVLQERTVSPLGSTENRTVDVRVIAATNRDLKKLVEDGLFRRDLYYRINVVEIKLPPLRERREDIPLLCRHFIQQNNAQQSSGIRGLSKDAEEILLSYDYPGNIRELANALEYACIVADGEWIRPEDLPERMTRKSGNGAAGSARDMLRGRSLKEIEKIAIMESFKRHRGKRKAIAAELGISERGLWNKIKEYGIDSEKDVEESLEEK